MSVTRETSEDADSLGDASSQPDTVSIASRTSQNTADSDKVAYSRSHTQTHTHTDVYRRSTHCDTEGCVVHSRDLIAGSIWPCWVFVCVCEGVPSSALSDCFEELSLVCGFPDEVGAFDSSFFAAPAASFS